MDDPSTFLRMLFAAAVAAAAAAGMAAAVERQWPGPLKGLVVTRYGHGVPCERLEVVEAAHPLPDAAGRILEMARGLSADDLLICLFSGGGSALLAHSPPLGLRPHRPG